MVNQKFQHHTPFFLPTKVTLKCQHFIVFLLFITYKEVFLSYLPCQMNILPCGVIINTFEIRMQKCVHTTYTSNCPNRLFGFLYQQQALHIMRLSMVQILLPYRLTWADEPLNTSRKTPLFKTKWFFMVSNFWCQPFVTLLYWERRKKFIQENIIVDKISTNIWPLLNTHFYVNLCPKFKCKVYIRWNGDPFQK